MYLYNIIFVCILLIEGGYFFWCFFIEELYFVFIERFRDYIYSLYRRGKGKLFDNVYFKWVL